MEEQLITFETASLAKEKGLTSDDFDYCPDLCYNKKGYCYRSEGWIEDDYFCAITQSLLQKWLREKHHLIVIVSYQYEHDFTPYSYWIYKENNSLPLNKWIDDLNTYEEALELGLQEALKLII